MGGGWWCYDVRTDPGEHMGHPGMPGCGPLIDYATEKFAFVWH
jgi:hypothetical protein